MNAPLWLLRLKHRWTKPQRYRIRYRGRTSIDLWTMHEAVKLMRLIPVKESLEVLLPDGRVHFTLPSRKE